MEGGHFGEMDSDNQHYERNVKQLFTPCIYKVLTTISPKYLKLGYVVCSYNVCRVLILRFSIIASPFKSKGNGQLAVNNV